MHAERQGWRQSLGSLPATFIGAATLPLVSSVPLLGADAQRDMLHDIVPQVPPHLVDAEQVMPQLAHLLQH